MKILLGILAGVLVGLGGGLAWLGMFTPLEVRERPMGPYQFCYVQETTRDFGRIGELTEQLGTHLEQAGYTVRKPAQVFFPPDRGIPNQIGFLVDRPVTREVLGAERYFRPISEQRVMFVEFPFRNALSFLVGYWRVESAFAGHRKGKGYGETSAMVILEGDAIHYLQPIEQ